MHTCCSAALKNPDTASTGDRLCPKVLGTDGRLCQEAIGTDAHMCSGAHKFSEEFETITS